MDRRTIIEFAGASDIWPVVDKWAGENGYRLKESGDAERLYQKGVGFLVAPMMLKIRRQDQSIHLEAWVRAYFFVRLMSLFILPAEMGIKSGGLRGVWPRTMAREAVNKLLAQLGQPPIP